MRIQASIPLSGRAAFIVGTLLNAIFVAVGLFIAYPGYQRYLVEGMSQIALQEMAFGSIFVAIGLLSQFLLGRRNRRAGEGNRLREEHPDEPWHWRADWSSRHLVEEAAPISAMILFAVVWNAFSWPLAIYISRNPSGTDDGWVVWLFPVIGLIVAGIAVVAVMRRRKFGWSVFELNTLPGRVGGVLSGVARTGIRAGDMPDEGVYACLSCYHRVVTYHRDSKGHTRRDVNDRLLWRDEKHLRGMEYDMSARMAIPIRFDVPLDQPATTLENPDDCIVWRIELAAELPGFDYAAKFEVPVFQVDAATVETEPAGMTDANSYASYEVHHDRN